MFKRQNKNMSSIKWTSDNPTLKLAFKTEFFNVFIVMWMCLVCYIIITITLVYGIVYI